MIERQGIQTAFHRYSKQARHDVLPVHTMQALPTSSSNPVSIDGPDMISEAFLGLDIGSTTVKLVLVTPEGAVIEAKYLRHGTAVRPALCALVSELAAQHPDLRVAVAMTGSAALDLAHHLRLPFVQEVMAAARAITRLAPHTDVAVELGGEDAKILYFDQGMELRMNEACAGGTGAFIDQMATLLETDAAGLDLLAAGHTTIYPIASRCGVFAKTDIVPLLNEGASRNDLAASIFQAVVEQTIGGLACGHPIRGNVAFLGGPLHFLTELRRQFIATLGLQPEEVVDIPNGQHMVALGAALCATENSGARSLCLKELAARMEKAATAPPQNVSPLPPLFASEADYSTFRQRHAHEQVRRRDLSSATGMAYLGIDLGSTTVKTALIDQEGFLLASWYGRNRGDPLAGLVPHLIELLDAFPPDLVLGASAATGYGAQLAQAGLGLDFVDVETVAHLKAACHLVPECTYVIDIGGQDMKCLKADNGVIAGVTLNEACSAGCGAFLETFARSLKLDMETFVCLALHARQPVDLGSRCTVFMNSKVKQAQKEGADIGDIAAGLCYSVARNALYKVLRLRDPAELGRHVLVQGGSFLNDALLRAMEKLLKQEIYRPDIAGLMGAYGAALLAREHAVEAEEITDGKFLKKNPRNGQDSEAGAEEAADTRMIPRRERNPQLTADALRALRMTSRTTRCKGCGNHCLLTINTFSNGRRLVSGNRCERGAGEAEDAQTKATLPNLYAWKEQRLFNYSPLPLAEAPRGRLGIPRVLNLYEHYPFWFTLFTRLGYRVEVSPPSRREVFALGLASVPSQSVCYPAKLAHGHVLALINSGIRTIFFPCIPRETRESGEAADCYNCPVVCGYPQVVRLNTDELREKGCTLHTPFVQPAHEPSLVRTLCEEFNLPAREVRQAARAARAEMETYRAELRAAGEQALHQIKTEKGLGIVLGGRPYHADPAIHHGLPDLVVSLGAAVLSEDSIAHLATPATPEKKNRGTGLRVVDQWTYHSRLYRAAALVGSHPLLELIQLTSFGCGLDAITADQVCELLMRSGKLHTLIKIDEGASLGAARIRIRSLMAAVHQRRRRKADSPQSSGPCSHHTMAPRSERPRIRPMEQPLEEIIPPGQQTAQPIFTRTMRRTHIILAPQLAPLHFDLLAAAMNSAGYQVEVLPSVNRENIETGLNVVHNDACYPALVVIGQLMDALGSGHYDPDRTALLLAQTCGPCRASNYPALLRKALTTSGFSQVPVLTVSSGALERQPGFRISARLLHRLILGCLYGDMLQRVSLFCRTYECHAGDTAEMLASWMKRARSAVMRGDSGIFKKDMSLILRDFMNIHKVHTPRPRVGVVGEILLKYHPDANNQVLEIIRQEGGEPVLTDFTDFLLYCLMDQLFDWRHLGGKIGVAMGNWLLIQRIERLRDAMRRALAEHPEGHLLLPVSRISHLGDRVNEVISTGNTAGEGWLLTADMLELVDCGTNNVLCLQPFGCLPNHITGKGVIRELRRVRPQSNIMAIDYDPGTSETNQINRIKLFMSVAREQMNHSRDALWGCSHAC